MLGHVPPELCGGSVPLSRSEYERIAFKLLWGCNASFSQLCGAIEIGAGTLKQDLRALL